LFDTAKSFYSLFMLKTIEKDEFSTISKIREIYPLFIHIYKDVENSF
jgi:hypothetical protein